MDLPVCDTDLYSDDVLADPYDCYANLRSAGPVVYCSRHHLWAVSRFADVRACLRDHEVFSSASGVAACPATNEVSRGNLLASDPPEHPHLRAIVGEPLGLREIRQLEPRIDAEAKQLVATLKARGSFDAVADFARYLPLKIVSELVGLPEDGRENMLRWAAATFDALGADNERTRTAWPAIMELRAYTARPDLPETVKSGSWSDRLFERGRTGEIPADKCPVLMRDYLGPSLDTTIFATANLIWLFGRFPEQWDRLRRQPDLIPSAIAECVRLESPVRGFTRLVTRDTDIDGAPVKAGSRVLLLYASANRDERKWTRPDDFDIGRNPTDHLGFGNGIHTCAGMHLAKLEMNALLRALLPVVSRFELGEPIRAMNNVLRGFVSLPVTVR